MHCYTPFSDYKADPNVPTSPQSVIFVLQFAIEHPIMLTKLPEFNKEKRPIMTEAITDLMDLLKIDGPPSKEADVAAFLKNRLIQLGVPAQNITEDNAQEQSEYRGNTGNLIAHIDGQHPGPRLMFSTHMDTVPDAVNCSPRIENDRIINDNPKTALGGDNRCGCAALLHLTRELIALEGNHPPITLIFFIQEEVGLVGARGMDLSMLGDPAMCFNLDGGRPDRFVTKVIGTERFTIDITGIASHAGGRPGDGISAAVIAAHALSELDRNGWHGKVEKPEGTGSANTGIVHGGQGSNVIMPNMNILAEARSHDPTFRKKIIDTWKDAFTRSAQSMTNPEEKSGSVTFGPGPTYEAFSLEESDPVVQISLNAAKTCGLDPQTLSNDGGMDANQIVAHGIPAITFGAGQRQVHTVHEWIDLTDFENACQLVTAIIKQTRTQQ
jgi:tripeptide aminopeptidase